MESKKEIIKEIRRDILEASYKAGACHIGSALSCVEILIDLFWKTMKPKDLFIFSKASGVATLYAILSKKGYFSKDKLAYYLKHYPLPSKEVPKVIWSGGSLGHGLPLAVGLALSDRTRNVYCLVGDGDVQEGTFYESILFARQHKLKNLKIIVDKNGLQACGTTKGILGIDKALKLLNKLFPIKVIKTIKGMGVDFLANKVSSHYLNLTANLYANAIFQITH